MLSWSASWSPAGAGTHLIQADLTNWSNVEFSHTITFTLDTQPPRLAIATSVLTSTHVINKRLPIFGSVSDANGIARVETRVLADGYGSDWVSAALDGTNWQALVYPGNGYEPDGKALTIEARAIDRAGWTQIASRVVTVDLQPPAPVDLNITYTDGSVTLPITQTGTLISSPMPTLSLGWPASSDGSGIASYRAGWTVQDASGTNEILAATILKMRAWRLTRPASWGLANQHYLVYDFSVAVGSYGQTEELDLDTDDVLTVRCSTADASFNFNGIERYKQK